MSVNGRPFAARQAGTCPAFTCRHGGQIKAGEDIKPVDGLGWIHEDDVTPVPLGRRPLPARSADELTLEAEADRLLNEYDNRREADRRARNARIPAGNYTVRPADERAAVVLSIGVIDRTFIPRNRQEPLPDGTRRVSVRGSFSILVNGLSEFRSWYGFALVKPGGQISLYKTTRAIMSADPADLRPEGVHLQSKLRLAIKALRLLIEAGEAEIMAYGKAYASAQSACWKCDRPLTDEMSQRLGIGPKCRQVLETELGKR